MQLHHQHDSHISNAVCSRTLLEILRTLRTACTSKSEDGVSDVCPDFGFARECRLTNDARNATVSCNNAYTIHSSLQTCIGLLTSQAAMQQPIICLFTSLLCTSSAAYGKKTSTMNLRVRLLAMTLVLPNCLLITCRYDVHYMLSAHLLSGVRSQRDMGMPENLMWRHA